MSRRSLVGAKAATRPGVAERNPLPKGAPEGSRPSRHVRSRSIHRSPDLTLQYLWTIDPHHDLDLALIACIASNSWTCCGRMRPLGRPSTTGIRSYTGSGKSSAGSPLDCATMSYNSVQPADSQSKSTDSSRQPPKREAVVTSQH